MLRRCKKIRPFGELAQRSLAPNPLRNPALESFSFLFLFPMSCLPRMPPSLRFKSVSVFMPPPPRPFLPNPLSLCVFLSLRSVTDRKRTTGPRSGGCENLTTLLMTFNEIHKTCRNLQKKGERAREREKETEGGSESERRRESSTARHQADSEQA